MATVSDIFITVFLIFVVIGVLSAIGWLFSDDGIPLILNDESDDDDETGDDESDSDFENEIDKELLDDALSGNRGDDQRLIAEEVVRWGALLIRKNTDYGSSVWQVPRLAPECDPGTAIRVRMSDKLSRLEQLLSNPAMVESESIDDTMKDLGAYCLLELARPNRRPLGE